MKFINIKYKDSVFTDLFGSDRDGKKNFLDLYNALSGNNDVSWMIDGRLVVLVEHQSTVNNMP
ncbi:MAG: hypothetical protein J6X11_10820 [Treponema sp.]|nr:hypothetical protein [Treponema sp.]